FWIELSWRIDPDGRLGIRRWFESTRTPGQKLTVDEYYAHIFDHSVPGLPERAAAEGLAPLEFMRRYGAFEIAAQIGPLHERRIPPEELADVRVDPLGRVYTRAPAPATSNIVPTGSPEPDAEGRRPGPRASDRRPCPRRNRDRLFRGEGVGDRGHPSRRRGLQPSHGTVEGARRRRAADDGDRLARPQRRPVVHAAGSERPAVCLRGSRHAQDLVDGCGGPPKPGIRGAPRPGLGPALLAPGGADPQRRAG